MSAVRAQPFERARKMFAAIAAAIAKPQLDERTKALAVIGEYKSRGKGKHTGMQRTVLGRELQDRSRYPKRTTGYLFMLHGRRLEQQRWNTRVTVTGPR